AWHGRMRRPGHAAVHPRTHGAARAAHSGRVRLGRAGQRLQRHLSHPPGAHGRNTDSPDRAGGLSARALRASLSGCTEQPCRNPATTADTAPRMSTHFAFDLDGTVTTAEMLPIIASALDLQNEMRLLTELTLNGTIGFEESFRLRCAILRSIPIDTVQEIVAEVPMDEHIAGFIRANPDRCAIVTGNLDVWIKPLVDRLGCRAFSSKARVHDNRLEAVTDILRKNHPIQQMRPYAQRIVAVGDSFN